MTTKRAPQSEVIQEWADFDSDGFTFERGRMEKNVQALCFGEHAAILPAQLAAGPSAGLKLKREDVDFLVNNLLMTKQAAEAALARNGGNFEKTLVQVVQPPKDL